MAKNISGYELVTPFTTVGSGSARWAFAEKDGKEYFLKEFLSPIYPSDTMNKETYAKRIRYCEEYEARKRRLYQALREIDNGNLVVIHDFFRAGTKYYIVTKRIREAGVTADKVHNLTQGMRLIIIKILTHCLVQLESRQIIHADLKLDNVMIKPTKGDFFALKLIDFDSSFFADDPPKNTEDLEGDPVYLSPEVFMGMNGEKTYLSSKVDVFAAGILFHQFLTGHLPTFDGANHYVFEAVINKNDVHLSDELPPEHRDLIRAMLDANPEKRPSFSEIFLRLSGKTPAVATAAEAADDPVTKESDKPARAAADRPPVGDNPWLRPAGLL